MLGQLFWNSKKQRHKKGFWWVAGRMPVLCTATAEYNQVDEMYPTPDKKWLLTLKILTKGNILYIILPYLIKRPLDIKNICTKISKQNGCQSHWFPITEMCPSTGT